MNRNKNIILLLFVLIATFLFACSTDKNELVDSGSQNEISENEEAKKQMLDKIIDVNETFEFEQFNIEFKKAKAYEKDDILLLDLDFSWRNKDTVEKALYSTAIMDVVQGDDELVDINDHWNPDGDRGLSNDVFLPNTAQGLSPVKLTYELINKGTDIEIVFTPTTEDEESKIITIKLE